MNCFFCFVYGVRYSSMVLTAPDTHSDFLKYFGKRHQLLPHLCNFSMMLNFIDFSFCQPLHHTKLQGWWTMWGGSGSKRGTLQALSQAIWSWVQLHSNLNFLSNFTQLRWITFFFCHVHSFLSRNRLFFPLIEKSSVPLLYWFLSFPFLRDFFPKIGPNLQTK